MDWHRLFGLILTDFFADSPFVVELEKDLALKKQLLDVVVLRREGVPAFDESFFVSLNRMVQEEPVQQRDLVAMGMLQSIGIEKGKEFKPDAATQRIFKAAAQEQLAMFVEGMKTFGQQWWDNQHWKLPDTRGVKTNFS